MGERQKEVHETNKFTSFEMNLYGLGLGYIAVPAYRGSLVETRSLQPDQNKKEKSPISGLKFNWLLVKVT